MSTPSRAFPGWSAARPVLSVLLAASWACTSGGDGDDILPPAAGSFTIGVSGASVSVAQSGSATLTVTVIRAGGFTGAVSLSAGGLAAGVTATFAPATVPTGQTSSTLTVAAGAAAATGSSAFTVTASAAGLTDQSAPVQLTVTPAAQLGPFKLSLSVDSYLALPPTSISWPPELTVTRDPGFTGPVTVRVSGVPLTLVAGVTPTNVTGDKATLLILDGGTPPGTYNATIIGTAAGLGQQTLTLPITVAPPTSGSIVWDFCENGARVPIYFLAVKDGAGPWTRIVPDRNRYSFNVASPTASVAFVNLNDGRHRTTVYQYTRAEMAAAAANECLFYPGVSNRTVGGTVTGLAAGEMSLVGMGWWFGSTINPLGGNVSNYTLLNLPPGPLDLVAIRAASQALGAQVSNSGIIRRATDPAPGASNALIDFNSAEAFPLATATWTFGNLNGESFSVSQHFLTASGTVGLMHVIPQLEGTPTVRTLYGIPAPRTVPGDLHQVIATVGTSVQPRVTRQIIAYARTLADRAVDFGPDLPVPTVTVLPGAPAGRIRAQGTLPTDYVSGVALDLAQSNPSGFATVWATRGFLGPGNAYDIQVPDLSAVLGWDRTFALKVGNPAQWWVSGGGPALDLFDGRLIFNSTRARWTGGTADAR